MSTFEEIYWALRELQGLGYAESPDGENWKLTPNGIIAAESLLESQRPADRVLLLMHVNDRIWDDNEGLDNAEQ